MVNGNHAKYKYFDYQQTDRSRMLLHSELDVSSLRYLKIATTNLTSVPFITFQISLEKT